MRKLAPVVACLSAVVISAGAQPRPQKTLTAVRTAGAIKVDGRLTEEVWQTPGAGGFTQRDPQDGAPATEETIVWVAYDRENLYVAARCRDSHPEGIIKLLARRDNRSIPIGSTSGSTPITTAGAASTSASIRPARAWTGRCPTTKRRT